MTVLLRFVPHRLYIVQYKTTYAMDPYKSFPPLILSRGIVRVLAKSDRLQHAMAVS